MAEAVNIDISDNIVLGNSKQVYAEVLPVNTFYNNVVWEVENTTGSADITYDGIITANKTGSVDIVATAIDGSEIVARKTVNIVDITDSAVLEISSPNIKTGESNVTVSVSIEGASEASSIQFGIKYNDEKINLVSAKAGELTSDALINTTESGSVFYVWDYVSEISDDGILLELEFSINEEYYEDALLVEFITDEDVCETIVAKCEEGSIQYTEIETEFINGIISSMEYILGDVNGDEKINVTDANIARRYAAFLITLDENQFTSLDVNKDGKVNVIDANLIRRYAAKLITSF